MLARILIALYCGVCCINDVIASENVASSKIIIVIDDVGYDSYESEIFTLPKEIAIAILPHTPYAQHYAWLAQHTGRDTLLHMPMEPLAGNHQEPLQLTAGQSKNVILKRLQQALERVPNAIGINNHMGSKLTQLERPLNIIMDFAKHHDLFFLDSRTTDNSKVIQVANAAGVVSFNRNIFLDNQRTEAAMKAQMKRLIKQAKQHKLAIAIAHPYPESIAFIKDFLPTLEQHNIQLTSLSQLTSASSRRYQSLQKLISKN